MTWRLLFWLGIWSRFPLENPLFTGCRTLTLHVHVLILLRGWTPCITILREFVVNLFCSRCSFLASCHVLLDIVCVCVPVGSQDSNLLCPQNPSSAAAAATWAAAAAAMTSSRPHQMFVTPTNVWGPPLTRGEDPWGRAGLTLLPPPPAPGKYKEQTIRYYSKTNQLIYF